MSYYQTMYGTDEVNTQFPIERIAKINGFTRDNGPIIELGGELIRCKDCKYAVDEYDDGECYCDNKVNGMVYIGKDWNHYCSWAERKEE